ncbi:thylakoid lumenal 17.9 kDa protein, chloroplastic [Silene latifolia]|uniref:thylakoid lumenal 17.9 kDa protein, chloroplastic n=1 Tax=Silene latifolia TaxID=37657 RepID=UPI003D778FB0
MRLSVIPSHLHPAPIKFSPFSNSINSPKLSAAPKLQNANTRNSLYTNLLSFSISLTITLSSPLPSFALPSLFSQPKPPSSSTTPFSQSKNLPIGLENGKIRACPSVNPSCVSTNPKSSSFDFPWQIPVDATHTAVQKLQEAILNTQKNAMIQAVEDTPNGKYIKAEIDGGFGRDVLEFLVKGDVATYRCMATKVTYVYPFTTAFGDSKGQQERMKKIVEELGWYAPSFDLMD